MATALKRTPLYHEHVAAGARMVPFGGWEMPVQYTGIIEEHRATRGAVGLFDVSHMGEFEVEGPGALAALQHLTTNDVAALEVGQIQYSVLCYPNGTIVDDLTVYRMGDERYMLTVNAGNIDKDWAHVTKSTEHVKAAQWRNASEGTGLIAVQGPKAEALVGRLADRDVTTIGYYRFARGNVGEVPTLISRTGYTGEDGFELYAPADGTAQLWKALLAAGRADGATPIGLGARDTLRLEMKYALYGNDIDDTTNAARGGARLGRQARQGRVHRPRGAREGPRRGPAAAPRRDRDGRQGRRASRLPGAEGRPRGRHRHLRLLRPLGRQVHRDRLRRDGRSPPSAPRSRSRSAARTRRPRSCARRSIRPR